MLNTTKAKTIQNNGDINSNNLNGTGISSLHKGV
jgi:hypothetical protein